MSDRILSRRILSGLLALALVPLVAACDASVDPLGVEAPRPSPPPPSPSFASVPVEGSLQGCAAATSYAPTGALYQICWPAVWNGSFIVYAHGYVSALEPLAIPGEAAQLAAFANAHGFGFASTSYRTNGLAVREGIEDIRDLAGIVRDAAAATFPSIGFVPVLLTGASEGGAVATLAAERHADVFQGALSVCGPTGDFQRQIDYLADFIVLFNYFFPQVFADGSGGFLVTPAGVAPQVTEAWATYGAEVATAVTADPAATAELLRVAGVPVDRGDPTSGLSAIRGILWYNVFATNDGIAKLGGTPFDNRWRWYWGSSNDFALNRGVQRFTGDPSARAVVRDHYETSGDMDIPYVSLHTTGDPIVEFEQQPLYRIKALLDGSWLEHSALPVLRYGHCNFEKGDLTIGLALLMLKVGASSPTLLAESLGSPAVREAFWDLLSQ